MALHTQAFRTGTKSFDLHKPEALDRLGLLTYGCEVDHLYNTYFPSAGFTAVAAAIASGLDVYNGSGHLTADGRISTVRPIPLVALSSPISTSRIDDRQRSGTATTHTRLPEPGEAIPPPERFYRIHSTYEPTTEFVRERARIEALL